MTTSMLIRRSFILPVLVSVGLASAACSGGGSGDIAPPTSSTTANSVPSTANNPVAAVDPCTLLSQSDITNLGLTGQRLDNTAKSRGCAWQKGPSYAVGIFANGSQGLEILRDASSTSVSLQSHDAIQTLNGINCLVDIAITTTSSVDISIEAGGGGVGNACEIAMQYATLIEPKLPAQQK